MHRPSTLDRIVQSALLVVATSALAAGCTEPSQLSTLDVDHGNGGNAHRPTGQGDADDPTNPGSDPSGPKPEVCDGWDNDRDGEVDEGTSGVECTTATGQGTTQCIDGRLICRECVPGSTRSESCGCSLPRTDVCNDTGRWLLGACATCDAAPTGTDCGFCGVRGSSGECIDAGECNPGEIMYVRCDICTPGDEECGVSCVGQKWLCQASCQWVLVEDCAPRTIQCDRDQVLYEPCGMCGYQKVECDGCFWTHSECRDEGICAPGSQKTVPCFDQACADGLFSTTTCSDSCTWEEESCDGCIPGPPTPPVTVDCVPGYACGVKITQTQCQGHTEAICGGADTLVIGQDTLIVLRDDCAGLECLPGEVTHNLRCTMGDGSCGNRDGTCGGTCAFAPSGPCHHVCDPGEWEETVACPEGCYTYTARHICDGCGWHTEDTRGSDCTAACTAGETQQVSCGNECYVRYDSCDPNTCTWRQGSCQWLPNCG